MKYKLTMLFTLLVFICKSTFAQQPPVEFFNGLKLINIDRVQAKRDMLTSIAKMPSFHGSYHFLGVIYSESNQQDSAIYFLNKAVDLNTANINKTKEMSYARLIAAYTYNQDFENAYKVGWKAYSEYPENQSIALNFKDACVWSYYIKYTGLDRSYLSPNVKKEYVVTSIPQEYLIMRKLVHNGQSIKSKAQTLRSIKGSNYDVHSWMANNDSKDQELLFKLNWNMDKEYGGKSFPTDKLLADKKSPIYERLGAILADDSDVDVKVGKLMAGHAED